MQHQQQQTPFPQQLQPPPYEYQQHQPPHQPCCSGQSPTFNVEAGVVTGSLQLIIGVLLTILNAIPFFLGNHGYPNSGHPIGTAVLLIIPAGIIGLCSKSRSNCVIIAYLVMSILAALDSLGSSATESIAAVFYSFEYNCDFGYFCFWAYLPVAVGLHAACAVLALAEFIVAIVASAYCCRSLACCVCGSGGCQCCGGTDVAATTQAVPDIIIGQYPKGTVVLQQQGQNINDAFVVTTA